MTARYDISSNQGETLHLHILVWPSQKESQLMASWRWLRLSSSCAGTFPGILATRGQASSHCFHRYGDEALQQGARQVAHFAAAELLFGNVPFLVHPHRFHLWKWPLLALFVQALLRRLVRGWHRQVRLLRIFHFKRRLSIIQKTFTSWYDVVQKRNIRFLRQELLQQMLEAKRRKTLISCWQRRATTRASLRQGTLELAMMFCRRTAPLANKSNGY